MTIAFSCSVISAVPFSVDNAADVLGDGYPRARRGAVHPIVGPRRNSDRQRDRYGVIASRTIVPGDSRSILALSIAQFEDRGSFDDHFSTPSESDAFTTRDASRP